MSKQMRRHGVKQSQLGAAFAGPPHDVPATSQRCRATHDVPYTLRCVLHEMHVHRVVRDAIVTSGEYAGARVVVYEPHQDKDGRTW